MMFIALTTIFIHTAVYAETIKVTIPDNKFPQVKAAILRALPNKKMVLKDGLERGKFNLSKHPNKFKNKFTDVEWIEKIVKQCLRNIANEGRLELQKDAMTPIKHDGDIQ